MEAVGNGGDDENASVGCTDAATVTDRGEGRNLRYYFLFSSSRTSSTSRSQSIPYTEDCTLMHNHGTQELDLET